MGMYLNFVDFGDGRYGIEAAAQGYFGKSVHDAGGQKNAITPYEAAVLASIIKQPYPIKGGYPGYDPNYNLSGAKDRWEYTMKNMLTMGWITQAEYDQRKYPTVRKPSTDTCKTCAADKPVGMIIRHVKAELIAAGITEDQFDQGGLTDHHDDRPRGAEGGRGRGLAEERRLAHARPVEDVSGRGDRHRSEQRAGARLLRRG